MRVAVIDIGSNSVLLLVAERTLDGWRVLTDQSAITRLGEGFEPDRTLKPMAVQRTLIAIEHYLQQCRAMGVERIVAVATAVVRKAANREVLLQPLQERGCPVRVLSEREEAELSFLAVALDPALWVPPPPAAEDEADEFPEPSIMPDTTNGELHFWQVFLRDRLAVGKPKLSTNGTQAHESAGERGGAWLVIDIGGGSVECAYGPPQRDTSDLRWRSLPAGAMTLREQLAPTDPPSPDEIGRVCDWLDEQFRFLGLLPAPEQIVTVGGTGVNLALLWHALHGSPATPEQIHGFRLTWGMLVKMLGLLLRLSDAERARLPGIEPERAPVLHLGALILERIMTKLQMADVRISTYGLRYGVLWSWGNGI